jgi:hypothetical protein
MARVRTARSARVRSRRLILLWYLLGIIFVIDGIWIILASASGGVSQWVGGWSEIVGGVVVLAGAVIGHRRARSR